MRHLRRFHIVFVVLPSNRFMLMSAGVVPPSDRFELMSADVVLPSNRFVLMSADVVLPSNRFELPSVGDELPSGSSVRMAEVVQEPDVAVALRYRQYPGRHDACSSPRTG